MTEPRDDFARNCTGCVQPLRQGLLGIWTCDTTDCPGNLNPLLERVASTPVQCIGCGHPDPTALHVEGCAEAQRKMREPVRFTPAEPEIDEIRAAGHDDVVGLLRAAARHPYKGPNDTDADMLHAAAKRLRGGFEPGGSWTKQTVAKVLELVASLIEEPNTPPATTDGGAS